MLSYERRQAIKKMLEERQSVSVEELAERFSVSPSTIRRDLDRMAGEGAVKRTYGGAVMSESRASEFPIAIREHENAEAKKRIGRAAAALIKNGDAVILDSSSTVSAMIPFLNGFDGLTVLTNGVKTAYLLNAYGKITTFCTGGRLREQNMSLVGAAACGRLEELNADIAFLSCRGMSPERGVTEASEEEAQVKKAMMRAAAKTVLLCDASKFGEVLMNRVCEADRLHALVTDRPLPREYAEYFASRGISVIVG